MSKTVVLLNPYGTDVTPYVNNTSGYAQLLNGTVASTSDTVYTLPYNWNVSSSANITSGAGLLDTKLNGTSGQILVFGYSEGCQIADYWLSNQATSTSVSPSNVTFLLIGNADRKYGGFAYNRSEFSTVGYTGGKPDSTPFTVVDFVRQYDPIGDFPNAAPIVSALTGLASVGSDGNAMTGAMQAVASVMASGPYSNAMTNCVAGLALIHTGLGVAGTGYMSVTTSDPTNLTLQDGNITWIWSPTYPVPMLGVGGTLPQSDYTLRTQIEQAYSRPVDIPMPNYSANSGWGIEPFPVPVTQAPVTGWWAELLISAHITITPNVSASKGHKVIIAVVVNAAVTATAGTVHNYTVGFAITPTVTVHAVLRLPRGGTTVISPTVSAAARLIKPITAGLVVHPSVAPVLKDRDGVAITVVPSVSVSATVTRHPTVATTITPSVTAAAVVHRIGAVAKTITPAVSVVGDTVYHDTVSKTITPTVSGSAHIVKTASVSKTVTPTVSVVGSAKTGANIPITVTPTISASAVVTRYATVSKTVTPTVTDAAVVTRFAAVSKTITPTASATLKDRDGVNTTITPSVTVSATVTRFATAAKTVTPSITAAGSVTRGGAVPITVTPSVAVTGKITKVGSVSKTITPTVTASGIVTRYATVSKNVTPSVTVSAVVTRFGSVSKTVTPTVSGVVQDRDGVSKTITPTITVTATVTRYATVSKSVTPSVSVSGHAGKLGAVSKTITPNVSAAVKLIQVGNVSKTITPSMSVAGGLLATGPTFDAAGAGATGNASSKSWTHTATAGAYGLVFCGVGVNATYPTGVTWGGTAMTQLGTITYGSIVSFAVYGLASVAGGAKTVTSTYAASHPQVCNSVSYTNVSTAGTPTTATGDSNSFTQSVTDSTGQMIVQAFLQQGGSAISSPSGGTLRSALNSGNDAIAIQDSKTSTTFTGSYATVGTSVYYVGIGVVIH